CVVVLVLGSSLRLVIILALRFEEAPRPKFARSTWRYPPAQICMKKSKGMGQGVDFVKHAVRYVRAMSAIPPGADMCSATAHVRFGPLADIPVVRLVSKK